MLDCIITGLIIGYQSFPHAYYIVFLMLNTKFFTFQAVITHCVPQYIQLYFLFNPPSLTLSV